MRTHIHTQTSLTSQTGRVLVKPATGVRGWRYTSWKMNGFPSETKYSGLQIHHISLIQLALPEGSVQDDIVDLNFPTTVHPDLLVEAAVGYVLCGIGQV